MKKSRIKRNAEEIQVMIDLYRANHSLSAIGARYDLSRERVRQLFEQAGVERRKQTVGRKPVRTDRFNAPAAELKKLYWEENKHLTQIAEAYQTSVDAVRQAFARHGIPLRTRAEITALFAPKFPELTESNLRRLYLTEKKSAQEIADLIGCARVTVYKKLQQFGIGTFRSLRKKHE